MPGDKLPEWKDFRNRYGDENEVDYLLARLEYNDQQGRARDHWLDNQIGAVLTTQDILRHELLGDGTRFRRGILNELADRQEEIKSKQDQIPSVVKDALKEARLIRQATEWTDTQKRLWRIGWIIVTAVITAMAMVVVGELFHIQLWNAK